MARTSPKLHVFRVRSKIRQRKLQRALLRIRTKTKLSLRIVINSTDKALMTQ